MKGVGVSVPRFVREKHRVTLGCAYDLEDAPLYSVKWYRDANEFYRYIPKEEPPTRVFPQPGLRVDVRTTSFVITKLSLSPLYHISCFKLKT